MEEQILITIDSEDGTYTGTVRYRDIPHPLGELRIGPEDRVAIKGKEYSFETLLAAIAAYTETAMEKVFDERGQMEIGKYLYRQVLCPGGKEILNHGDKRPLDIRILTEDEHALRLPWVFMAEKSGVCLTTAGCGISLANHEKWVTGRLPPCPKILIAAPQAGTWKDTLAEEHLKEIEKMLIDADHRYYRGNQLRIVYAWEDCLSELSGFQPDVFYFYGHGTGDKDKSRLVFTQGRARKEKLVAMQDLASAFRKLEKMPEIVYLNCCSGDTGGILGAGFQLGRLTIPAVLTNRTAAKITAAKAQAVNFWRRTILDGTAPHRAACKMQEDIEDTNLSYGDLRRTTPVIHCHYREWIAHPPQKINRLKIFDPHWALKLDRVDQLGVIYYLTDQMIRERKPKILVFLWYGEEGQGVELMHQRLKVELAAKLQQTSFAVRFPDWPRIKTDPNFLFEEMITEAFDVESLNHIPTLIRDDICCGRTDSPALIYLCHKPLRSLRIIGIDELKIYLEWLDTYFAPLLETGSFMIVGISFLVGRPEKFAKIMEERFARSSGLKKTVFRLIQELRMVKKQDLVDFIDTHNIPFPPSRLDEILQRIIDKTAGRYEPTLDELKEAINRPYDPEGPETSGKPSDMDFDLGIDDQ